MSKTEELYQILRSEIIRLKFRTDEIINEKDLAERFQVSKTPVREALGMLVQEGYLKKIPRVGYLLRELSQEEYRKLIYLRYTLERGVVSWLIANASDREIASLRKYCTHMHVSYWELAGINYDFHIAMARLTGNEYLFQMVQNTFDRMIRVPSPNLYTEIQGQPHRYHLKLIDAMQARNVGEATWLIWHECRRDDDGDIYLPEPKFERNEVTT